MYRSLEDLEDQPAAGSTPKNIRPTSNILRRRSLLSKPKYTPLLRASAEERAAALLGHAEPYPDRQDLRVDLYESDETIEAQLKQVARGLVTQWEGVPDSKMQIKTYAGGITNKLFCCIVKVREEAQRVLIRVYGDGTEQMIDRESEIVVFQSLHKLGFGPRFYGLYKNGCAYGHVDGRPLTTEDLSHPHLSYIRAEHIAAWHTQIEISQFPREPTLWDSLEKWSKLVPENFDHIPNKTKVRKFKKLKVDVMKEVMEVENLLKPLNSEVVFCHNDLLAGNFIYNQEMDTVMVIDYEYAYYNYRAFDIANHFCEYAGFEMDWSKFPDQATQLAFLKRYLEVYNHNMGVKKAVKEGDTNREVPLIPPSDEELHQFYVEVNKFTLASHLYWGIWALAQAKISVIDFDYFEYAINRWSVYMKTKNALQALS
jgi:ethanolamine kinase